MATRIAESPLIGRANACQVSEFSPTRVSKCVKVALAIIFGLLATAGAVALSIFSFGLLPLVLLCIASVVSGVASGALSYSAYKRNTDLYQFFASRGFPSEPSFYDEESVRGQKIAVHKSFSGVFPNSPRMFVFNGRTYEDKNALLGAILQALGPKREHLMKKIMTVFSQNSTILLNQEIRNEYVKQYEGTPVPCYTDPKPVYALRLIIPEGEGPVCLEVRADGGYNTISRPGESEIKELAVKYSATSTLILGVSGSDRIETDIRFF